MSGEGKSVGVRQLAGVFWRSFLLQAAWSFERMQSIGFAFAMLPVLRACYPDRDERGARVRAQADYFNTQPYLASFILGASARKEQDLAAGDPSADPAGVKAALAAPLGALGDSLFWAGSRPMAASVAVALVLAGAWWAPVFFLILYNVWHVGARIDLLLLGFRSGGDAASLMRRFDFPKMAMFFKSITLGIAGCVVGLTSVWAPRFGAVGQLPPLIETASALAVTLLLAAALRRGGSPIQLMLALAGISLILSLSGVFA